MSQEKKLTRATATNWDGRCMRTYWTTMAVLLIALISLTSFAGCGSGKKTPTPEQKEEQRQKMIKNAERERREG
jgi:hypothetical protein